MHADQPLAHVVADLEGGVGHAERREHMIAQIGIELLAAGCFHGLADEVRQQRQHPERFRRSPVAPEIPENTYIDPPEEAELVADS